MAATSGCGRRPGPGCCSRSSARVRIAHEDGRSVTAKHDPRVDVGLYSISEGARLARLPHATLRNWVAGYSYPAGDKAVRAKPVIRVNNKQRDLTFVNLVEVVALSGFRQAGVSMQRVRKALDYAERHVGATHLLANERILTDGVDLFWEYQERHREDTHLVKISSEGQKVFPETVMRYLREMDWGSDSIVARWWPERKRGSRGLVVVDPRRAFGAPVVAGTGVRTEDVFDRFQAGESIQDLIDDYGLTSAQVEAAVRLETLFEPYAAA